MPAWFDRRTLLLLLRWTLQVRVVIGGALSRSGDWVYADEDGVVVSREQLALPS